MNFTYLRARVLAPLGCAIAATVVPVSGQTWTTTLSGESSYNLAFVNGNTQPRTLTSSLQSPVMPTTAIGANDDMNHKYPSGNASGTPPWWFIYTNGNFTATDLTNSTIFRYPTMGQISLPKPPLPAFELGPRSKDLVPVRATGSSRFTSVNGTTGPGKRSTASSET